MATAAKIDIEVDAKTAKLQQGMDRAAKSVNANVNRISQNAARAAKSFALVTAAVTTLVAGIRRWQATFAEFDALGKLSRQLQLSANELLAYQEIVGRFGGSAEDLNNIFLTLQKNIGDASFGLGRAKVLFEELGLELEDLTQLNVAEQFRVVNQRINELSTEAEKAAARQKIFGASTQRLAEFLDQTDESLKDATESYKTFIGEINTRRIEDFNDSVDDLRLKAKSTFVQLANGAADIGEALAVSLTDYETKFPQALEDIRNRNENLGRGFEKNKERVDAFNASLLSANQGGLITDFTQAGQQEAVDTGRAYQEEVAKGIARGFEAVDRTQQFAFANRIGNTVSDVLGVTIAPLVKGAQAASEAAAKPLQDTLAALLPGGATATSGALSVINRSRQKDAADRARQNAESVRAINSVENAITVGFETLKTAAGF